MANQPPSDDAVRAAARLSATTAATSATERADDELLQAGDDGLICMRAMRYVESQVIEMMGGDATAAGRFLTALAVGEDTQWPATARPAQDALEVRRHLMQLLGDASCANATLRAMTNHGRLFPGLAPHFVPGTIVGTDELSQTPSSQLKEIRRGLLQKMVNEGAIDPKLIGR